MTQATSLLRWYRSCGRDLPWRGTQDAYKILVSEVMLQQTQVDRVKEKYREWLRSFPTWQHLARASSADVIHAWSGLGYNRRALMVHSIAKHLVEHGVPATREEWLRLKGIGPYTASALACFSLHERIMPIDTNIRRVLGRALLGKGFATLKDDMRIERRAREFLAGKNFFNVPQALFDLATSVCRKSPECTACPLRNTCPMAKKFLAGTVRIPKRSIPKSHERIHAGKKHPDRIYRGRILALVKNKGRVNIGTLGTRIDPLFDAHKDSAWLSAMIERLVKDGLVVKYGSVLDLPR